MRAIFSHIRVFSTLMSSHIRTIGVCAHLRALLFENNEDTGERA